MSAIYCIFETCWSCPLRIEITVDRFSRWVQAGYSRDRINVSVSLYVSLSLSLSLALSVSLVFSQIGWFRMNGPHTVIYQGTELQGFVPQSVLAYHHPYLERYISSPIDQWGRPPDQIGHWWMLEWGCGIQSHQVARHKTLSHGARAAHSDLIMTKWKTCFTF